MEVPIPHPDSPHPKAFATIVYVQDMGNPIVFERVFERGSDRSRNRDRAVCMEAIQTITAIPRAV